MARYRRAILVIFLLLSACESAKEIPKKTLPEPPFPNYERKLERQDSLRFMEVE
ncbi:MAG: hypothetical protein AAF740_04770 [Bacteroidota bacterium]